MTFGLSQQPSSPTRGKGFSTRSQICTSAPADFASASASWHLCKTVALPADSTLVVLGKDAPIYLEEGDRIRGLASAASDAQVTVSYEELDDA